LEGAIGEKLPRNQLKRAEHAFSLFAGGASLSCQLYS
jgi:hypothetical protein